MYYTSLRWMLLLGLLACAGPGMAADPAQACMDCHGKDGASTESDMPTIGGASRQYIIDNLAAYREKSRPCPESKYRAGDKTRAPTDMCKIAADLNPQDTEKLADYYSSKPFVRAKQQADEQKAAKGKQLHSLHCEKCHADGGSSAEDDAGILAGQWMPYLRDSMKEFTSGKRQMPEKMKPKVEKLSPEDVEALIHYYGSQN